jgi:GT2 family glycosyltransferase
MNARTIFALVVVYNKTCGDSEACRMLLRADPPVRAVVFDNSERDFGNREWCDTRGWAYLGGGGNVGLPKAYNIAVSHCLGIDPEGVLCVFDDDGRVSDAFFGVLRTALLSNEHADILIPILRNDGRILSPCLLRKDGSSGRFRSEEKLRAYRGKHLTAVNNALAVRLRVFRDFRYDERLFLDMVDHSFFREMNRRGRSYIILEGTEGHSISSHEHPSREAAVRRFEIFLRDVRVFLENQAAPRAFAVLRRTARLTVEYRSVVFIRMLFDRKRDQANDSATGDTKHEI